MQKHSYLSTPLCQPQSYCSIADVVRNNASLRPHQEILIHRKPNGERFFITNVELENRSTAIAKYLRSVGIKKSEYVGIVGPNTIEWLTGEVAILKTGAVSVHLSISLSDAQDAMDIIDGINCRYILMDPGVDMEMKTPLHTLQTRINEMNKTNPEKKIQTFLLRLCQDFEASMCFGNTLTMDIDIVLPVIYPESPAVVFCTSGSTGQPKLVQMNHFTVINTARNLFEGDEIYYCDRPFVWLGGSPLFYLAKGIQRLFVDSTAGTKDESFRFICDSIKKEKCSHALFVPYILSQICDYVELNPSEDYRLKSIIIGGEMIGGICNRALRTVCLDSVTIIYASTETGIASRKTIKPDVNFETGDVGVCVQGVEVKIIKENGDNAFWGSLGEICIRSNCMSEGYLNAPEWNKDLFLSGGWMRTGDIGKISEEGNLIIVGKMKTVISRGTRKLIPAMIEEVIRKIPGLKEVYVIGVPDKRLLEEVCVCYLPDAENDIEPEKLQDLCSDLFLEAEAADGMGEAPTYFVQINDIPVLNNGKVDKLKLKEIAISKLGLS